MPNPYLYNDPDEAWGVYQGPAPFGGDAAVVDALRGYLMSPQIPLQSTDAQNFLDPWRVDRAGSAAANPLDLYGISGPTPPPAVPGFMSPNDIHALFFDRHYGPAARALAPYDVDPALALGVAAQESGWGGSRQAQKLGNPFGHLPGGQPSQFGSPEEAWQAWAQEFGPRVRGVQGDVAQFVRNLDMNNIGVYGPVPGARYTGRYNSDDPEWSTKVPNLIQNVRDFLPRWLGYYDGMP